MVQQISADVGITVNDEVNVETLTTLNAKQIKLTVKNGGPR